jgi:Family of unknown function (DUF6868)
MTLEAVRSVLLWCTIIDYAIVTVWFLAFVAAHDWLMRLHGRWFHLTHEQFDALNYAGMAVMKIGIMLFNLVPLIALYIVG